jgi:ribosomal protein L32E
MHRVVKLTARAPGVSESSIIDAIVGGLRVGNCQDVLDRIKPKSLQELFEVMQEYCKSDKGRRRRLDRANAAKKQKQQGQWDQPKGWQNHQPKQANRQINNVSAPPDQNQNQNSGRHKGGYKNGRGPKPQQQNLPQRGDGERFLCWLHGIDAQHHTHQCPSAVKMKLKWEAEEKAKAAGLAVNHVMKYQNAGQFRALPPPYHHQSFQPSAPTHVFHPPQSYTPSAPQLPPPPPMHAQQLSVFVPSWPNPAAHHQTHAQPPPPPLPEQEAPDSSSSRMMGMVNIINAISGGSNEPVHETKRQWQEYYRSVSHICSGKYFHFPWSHIPITFMAADIWLQYYPHNDPLVIRANIGKNTKYYFGNDVGRVLVDNGSSADILTWQCFSGMGFQKEDLKKAEHPLYGFGNKRIEALAKIDVNVTFGQEATMRTEVITFDVVDFVYPYNAIFGRNTINKFAAVIHQGYLLMKIPTATGVISVYGSQEEARRVECNTSVHNRQVHVINEDEGNEAVVAEEQRAEAQMRQSMKGAEAERMKAVDVTKTVPLCVDVPSRTVMIGTEVSAEDEGNSCSSFVITRMCSHGPSRI